MASRSIAVSSISQLLEQDRFTTSAVPRAPVTVTLVPAGASGPSANHSVSPTRTLPRPHSIASSTTSNRPMYCWPRTLRSGTSHFTAPACTYFRTHSAATTEKTPKATTCHCQVMSIARASTPTPTAAKRNQRKCTPGTIVSSRNSATTRKNQFHGPNPAKSANSCSMPRLYRSLRLVSGSEYGRLMMATPSGIPTDAVFPSPCDRAQVYAPQRRTLYFRFINPQHWMQPMHALFDPLKNLTSIAVLVLTLFMAATTAVPQAKAGVEKLYILN